MFRLTTIALLAASTIAGLSACGGGSTTSGTSSTSATTATAPAVTAPQGDLRMFSTETEAQHVCPQDEIVWLNPVSGIYHEKSSHLYGHTKRGNYVCRKAADAAGDRDSKAS